MNTPDGFKPFPDQGPFLELIGPIQVCVSGEGPPVFGVRAEERHANPRGTVQGGLLATLVDFALARAIHLDAAGGDGDGDLATVSLTIDYLKPANPGDWIESRTSVDRVGGTLAFADCTLQVGDREVVRARAVFVVAG